MESSEYVPGNKVAFGFGALADNTAYQAFAFLVFTFYYAVIGIDINLVTIGYSVWAVWNAVNDPLAGLLSDRTKTKYGRRIPYIAATFIPMALLMYFLWTPPVDSPLWSFFYFLVVIMTFDGIYSIIGVNFTAMFPEMFLDEDERTSANNYRQIFVIVGLIIAFVTPTLLISDMSAKETEASIVIGEYQQAGILLAVIVAVGYLIALKWGLRERKEFAQDSLSVPNWSQALKHTFSNRSFHCFLIVMISNWYVFGILPTLIPLYGQFVLGIGSGESIMLGLLLGSAFISGALFVNFWKAVVNRWRDLRKAWIASMAIWILTLLPLLFVNNIYVAFVVFALNGIGLSGSLYIKDLVIADIIDEDEVKTGARREGSFFGVNALIMRFSTIFVFLSINLVFNNVGWTVFTPEQVTYETLLGLRLLMSIFPSVALLFGILGISKYKLTGDQLKAVKERRDELHLEKERKVGNKKQ